MSTSLNKTYYNFFVNSCNNFQKQVKRKLKSSNTLKLNGEPVFKVVSLTDISRNMFAYDLGKYFHPDEKLASESSTSSPLFGVSLLHRLLELVDVGDVIKVHAKGDVTMITPIMKIETAYNYNQDGKVSEFCAGWLAIPVRTSYLMVNKVYCFLPSSGLDDDDSLATWVEDVRLESLGLNLSPSLLKERKYEGEKETQFSKGEDGGYLPEEMDGDLIAGDFLKISGSWYEVRGFAVLRERPGLVYVTLTRQVIRSSKSKIVTYAKKLALKGKMLWLERDILSQYRHVTFKLSKIDSDGFGTMDIKYQNIVFNKLGFLCHDCVV